MNQIYLVKTLYSGCFFSKCMANTLAQRVNALVGHVEFGFGTTKRLGLTYSPSYGRGLEVLHEDELIYRSAYNQQGLYLEYGNKLIRSRTDDQDPYRHILAITDIIQEEPSHYFGIGLRDYSQYLIYVKCSSRGELIQKPGMVQPYRLYLEESPESYRLVVNHTLRRLRSITAVKSAKVGDDFEPLFRSLIKIVTSSPRNRNLHKQH